MNNVPRTLRHVEVVALLPWLINGSLSENERNEVLDHAGSCILCRREIKDLGYIQEVVSRDADALKIPAPDVRRIMSRIEDYEDHRIFDPVTRFLSFYKRHRYFAFMAQGAAILLLVAVLMWPETPEPQFTTLTQIENLSSGNYIRAVFKPDLSESDVLQIVSALSLDVVAGPSGRGVYTIGVDSEISSTELDELASSLRGQTNVLFAESIRIGVAQ